VQPLQVTRSGVSPSRRSGRLSLGGTPSTAPSPLPMSAGSSGGQALSGIGDTSLFGGTASAGPTPDKQQAPLDSPQRQHPTLSLSGLLDEVGWWAPCTPRALHPAFPPPALQSLSGDNSAAGARPCDPWRVLSPRLTCVYGANHFAGRGGYDLRVRQRLRLPCQRRHSSMGGTFAPSLHGGYASGH